MERLFCLHCWRYSPWVFNFGAHEKFKMKYCSKNRSSIFVTEKAAFQVKKQKSLYNNASSSFQFWNCWRCASTSQFLFLFLFLIYVLFVFPPDRPATSEDLPKRKALRQFVSFQETNTCFGSKGSISISVLNQFSKLSIVFPAATRPTSEGLPHSKSSSPENKRFPFPEIGNIVFHWLLLEQQSFWSVNESLSRRRNLANGVQNYVKLNEPRLVVLVLVTKSEPEPWSQRQENVLKEELVSHSHLVCHKTEPGAKESRPRKVWLSSTNSVWVKWESQQNHIIKMWIVAKFDFQDFEKPI